jgi:adenylate cyclase
MHHAQFAEFIAWISEAGLAGQTETALLTGFCERALALGLPVARATALIDTLHPVYEGRMFTWQRDKQLATLTEYGRGADVSEHWRRSPFYHLLQSGERLLRRRLTAATEAEFPILPQLRAAGMTDYVAIIAPFAAEGIIGEMDGVYSSWATDTPHGFRACHVADLRRLAPLLALAVKSASLARITGTLVETYLGRDAGRRVLSGRIARGVADRIEAVLWFSDLRDYTRIADTAPPEQVIPLLNDYGDVIISAIHQQGGDVLKLMGDGALAIFTADHRTDACHAALAAAGAARKGIAALNQRRPAEGLPITDMYLGLHVGEVFYGNIGSEDRLDFTVIGPAVNEVGRIAAMCRSVDQPVLLSSAFAAAAGEARSGFVSVGRYALRGVERPQELFTLDPTVDARDAHS